jgi:UV DNA damage endonuclease
VSFFCFIGLIQFFVVYLNQIKNKHIMITLGYACMNTQLRKENIFTGRTMRKATFEKDGLIAASKVNLLNVGDLLKIVIWNNENNIKVFRMSSDIMTWNSEYDLKDLPDYEEIKSILKEIGIQAKLHNQRLSSHPGAYNVLASPNPKTVNSTIDFLNKVAVWMDLIGLPQSPASKINIHVGGAYGDKEAALNRFVENFKKLSYSAQSRLTIENDDKASMYSVQELYDGIYKKINIPIVFDYHHHKFCTGNLTEEQALKLAAKTWPKEIKQCTHYSESMLEKENAIGKKPQAHSNFIYDKINDYDLNIDCVIEAKEKEAALLNYRKTYNN